eukprot:TRINITY_DN4706_c0_g1_i3.p1 TRINITY_DN4706_c0_g1~~TRINITY_DN4706_c0_g1_i3.p1  ORF type:complete len:456 (-),score=77.96 TRINITY_DN4706_c0_g1_i3:321-1688(-)
MTASEQTALLKKGEPQSLGVLAMIYQLGSTVLGLYCNGVNMMIMNLVLTILVVDSPATAGLLTSIFNIGQLCGQFFFGPLVDIAGPKVASLSTAAVGVVGAMIAASAGTLMPFETQLLIGRFVTGMGNGGEYPVVASLSKAAKAHFTPRQLLTCSMALQFGGNATIQSLYLILIPLGLPPGLFWRSLLAAAGLPPLACFVMRLHLQVPSEADGIASLQQAAAAPSRQVSPGRTSGYGVMLRKSWAEKGWAYIAAVLSWSCAHMIIQVTGSYLHVFVNTAAAGPNVQPRALLLYNGLQALSVSLMTMFGCFSAFFFLRFMQIEWTQGLCMLMVASLILVEAALGEEHGLLTLVTVALNSFPQGVVSVTTYTIVAEMFPREAVGFFMGIAGILVFLTALPVATFFPVFIDAYGLGMAELAASFITFLGAMATLSILKLDKSASLKSDSESLSGIGSA